ncbi:MAG: hypothetical protein HY308_03035 [Gammaproteobacteria bacterium]|nr:hypothetical protein [Gammaproteobacteria bacterium]
MAKNALRSIKNNTGPSISVANIKPTDNSRSVDLVFTSSAGAFAVPRQTLGQSIAQVRARYGLHFADLLRISFAHVKPTATVSANYDKDLSADEINFYYGDRTDLE